MGKWNEQQCQDGRDEASGRLNFEPMPLGTIEALPMTEVCFFNQQTSDVLQHIAVGLEVLAIYLVCRDYGKREFDLAIKGRSAMLGMFSLPMPHKKRIVGLILALVIGLIAVGMEFYQLASQYFCVGFSISGG